MYGSIKSNAHLAIDTRLVRVRLALLELSRRGLGPAGLGVNQIVVTVGGWRQPLRGRQAGGRQCVVGQAVGCLKGTIMYNNNFFT